MTWDDPQPYEHDTQDGQERAYRRDGSSRPARRNRPSSRQDGQGGSPREERTARSYRQEQAPRSYHPDRMSRGHADHERREQDWHDDGYPRDRASRTHQRERDDRSNGQRPSSRTTRHVWQDQPYDDDRTYDDGYGPGDGQDEPSFQPYWQNEQYRQSRREQFMAQRNAKQNPASRTRMQRLVDQIKAHRTLSIVMLACVLVVTLAGVIGAVQMYQQYSATRSEASSGMQHLKRVQALAKPLTKQLTIPDPILVQSIKTELTLAENDFARARQDASGWGVSLAAHAPVVGGSAGSAINLITAADEATRGGLSLVNALELAQPLLHGGFLAPETGTKTPLLTPATMNLIIQDFETAVGKFNSAVTLAQNADLSAIPTSLVSASQRSDLNQLVAKWPSVQAQLQSVDAWLQLGPSMLGLNGPQRYLIQLLDRGEMRSTGGFVGSYGILTMQSGQMQPFTLNDSFGLDVPYIQRDGPQPPPAKYYWWPFSGYALRDSNLSFDFPTSAKYGIQLLKQEGGPDVQGVAAITIPVIQRAMKVIGDVPLPEYGVTVTGDNLEAMIRLYTETKAANVGSDLPPSDQLTTLHQRFTALLGRAFMAKLHKATPKQLVSIAQIMMASLPTKELQVYLSNPTAEGLLKAHGFDNSIARGPQDAITAVDSNTAGNKANLFITVKYNDAVTIDAHGTATHHLTIAYDFNHNSNPEFVHYLYDRWYYKDYLRVYTPANSKLISYDGFNDGDLQINVSDEPGRQMWGGYVWMAEGGIYALHFTYTVPNAATQDSAGHWHYPLIFQHQAASKQQLTLTVTLPGASKPIQVYNGVIDRDRLFNIQ